MSCVCVCVVLTVCGATHARFLEQALEQMAMAGDGMLTDPATGESFAFEEAKKAFIV